MSATRDGDPAEAAPDGTGSVLHDPGRLRALWETALLGTPPEDAFDRLARVAAHALRAPVAVITLVDDRRHFLKGSAGLPEPWASQREVPLSYSPCRQVVEQGAPVVVSDAREPPSLRGSPSVGEIGLVAYAAVPLRTAEGHVLGCLGVVDQQPREWTARELEVLGDLASAVMAEIEWRRDAQERARAESHLRRAERLASLGTLLSGVAHELNNPLAAIKSFAQLLLLDERPADDQEALEVIEREAARAAKIVSDLRLVARQARRGGEAREPVQLNDVVRHVLEMRGYTLQTHNVEVRDDLAPDLPPVLADRGELEQAVLHLVLNAEHSLAEHPGERRLTVRTRAGPSGVSLRVVDSGPGIPEEHLDRIFDPFWTTREPGKGTGLGLSMVHGIVAEHGGRIRVESEPGKGASFTIDLPGAVPPLPGTDAAEEGAPRGLRVLVVDDEPPIRRSLVRYLERRGHRVDEAADGREALVRIGAAEAAPYDVILADLRMPGLSGDRLLAELRARETGVEDRVVFITGDALSDETAAALASVPVIFKPFELEQVARALETRGRRAGSRGE